MTSKNQTAAEIAEAVEDGHTVVTVGMTLTGSCEEILTAIEERFERTGHPANLTLVHGAGQSDREGGIQHLAHQGLTRRIIGSHWGLAPQWMEMITEDKVEAFCLPQGQMMHWYRAMARGETGLLSRIGLNTFIDPMYQGGKMNARTLALDETLVERVTFQGQSYLWYKAVPLDWALIRGTAADGAGNLSAEEEPMKLEMLSVALATKASGGHVVTQVKYLVPDGAMNARHVIIPGVLIDRTVLTTNAEQYHRQSSHYPFDARLCGLIRDNRPHDVPQGVVGPDVVRRLIGRRAAWELPMPAIINLGTGIPNDEVGQVIREEELTPDITVTVESGVYGGEPVGGIDFGVAFNPVALIEHGDQFEFYNGHGVDVTFMGFGEVDGEGNVNSTKFNGRATGAGGFIDITQRARKVVFCGTFTARGLSVEWKNEQLHITQEGSQSKFVEKVQQVSFNGQQALANGQVVMVVTERCVLEWTRSGWVLLETAPGIAASEIQAAVPFPVRLSSTLQVTDVAIYSGPMHLRDHLARVSLHA